MLSLPSKNLYIAKQSNTLDIMWNLTRLSLRIVFSFLDKLVMAGNLSKFSVICYKCNLSLFHLSYSKSSIDFSKFSICGNADATSAKSFSVSYCAIPIGWVMPRSENSAFLLLLVRQRSKPMVGLSSGDFTKSSTA